MGDVHVRLLPLPGFAIDDLKIGDDPAFSSEPMIIAGAVRANLRLAPLWRGRLEIAQLSFVEPSLNLVRNAQGRWNVESLLLRGTQIPTAPTALRLRQGVPRFPHIEADNGRINFKLLNEKKPYILADADFSFWQESDLQWNLRLEARPTRTDQHLNDTGTVQVTGNIKRSPGVDTEDMPFDISVVAKRAQLGQTSSLLLGRDVGFRGTLEANVRLRGTLKNVNTEADISVTDFRRYDVLGGNSLDLQSHCSA